MVASSSGSMVTSGGTAAASTGPSAKEKGHSTTGAAPSGAGRTEGAGLSSARCSSVTMRVVNPPRPPRKGRMLSARCVSTKASLDPESSKP